mgnify:CR=1 FL=1
MFIYLILNPKISDVRNVLSVIEIFLALIISFVSGFSVFSAAGAVQVLYQMIGINLLAYIAVMPIIAVTAQIGGSFTAGVGFAFFYALLG